eukprot:NODE_18143_length_908_cov_3.308579.p1 GENE.NODE_18143_length_908_cov_3.308579~~NODE_18143_length_908_cov_3.308579.p1  ORF type:complete len:266 (+),score=46.54 NODE_18143_length_908_cov_3.308579:91-888(+)
MFFFSFFLFVFYFFLRVGFYRWFFFFFFFFFFFSPRVAVVWSPHPGSDCGHRRTRRCDAMRIGGRWLCSEHVLGSRKAREPGGCGAACIQTACSACCEGAHGAKPGGARQRVAMRGNLRAASAVTRGRGAVMTCVAVSSLIGRGRCSIDGPDIARLLTVRAAHARTTSAVALPSTAPIGGGDVALRADCWHRPALTRRTNARATFAENFARGVPRSPAAITFAAPAADVPSRNISPYSRDKDASSRCADPTTAAASSAVVPLVTP